MYLSKATILHISLEIERRGIAFYTAMKKRITGDFLDYLIEQEKAHIRTFNELFSQDSGTVTADRFETPHLDDDFLVAAYGDTEVFGATDPDSVSPPQLFDIAIEMEKNSFSSTESSWSPSGRRFRKKPLSWRSCATRRRSTSARWSRRSGLSPDHSPPAGAPVATCRREKSSKSAVNGKSGEVTVRPRSQTLTASWRGRIGSLRYGTKTP